ncbi:hypothetical protein DPMN_043453 [Dreissena polymorpha]|uniref:Uncharacterized protein n=1 Tax=Dreissena polymorpha TaxID=45954 RepID=A0A9D4D3Z8_DREPO|nr:hypothetical protein DPMN_043453 [Dreissena polymorpha]
MATVDAIPSACTVNQIDWSKEQSCDRDISQVIDMVHSGTKTKDFKDLPVSVKTLIRDFDRLLLIDEVLYRNSILDGEQVRQLVVPYTYRLIACRVCMMMLAIQGATSLYGLLDSVFTGQAWNSALTAMFLTVRVVFAGKHQLFLLRI